MLGLLLALDISGSTVDIAPGPPPAWASVVFLNERANSLLDNGDRVLELDGVAVPFEFTWDADPSGADRITIMPPLGYKCEPASCAATVTEGGDGRVLIMPYLGF